MHGELEPSTIGPLRNHRILAVPALDVDNRVRLAVPGESFLVTVPGKADAQGIPRKGLGDAVASCDANAKVDIE